MVSGEMSTEKVDIQTSLLTREDQEALWVQQHLSVLKDNTSGEWCWSGAGGRSR